MRKHTSSILVLTTLSIVIASLLIILSCGDDNDITGPADSIAPARINDLSVEVIGEGAAIKLYFTAVGDDSLSGTAKSYRLYYSNSPIEESDWQDANFLDLAAKPPVAGQRDTVVTDRLQPNRGYFLVLQVCDEAGNCSLVSNMVICYTSSRGYWHLPAMITDLVVTDVNLSSVQLTWTAPGADSIWGLVNEYEVHYGQDSAAVSSGDSAQILRLTEQNAACGELVSYWVRDLLPEEDYWFTVVALNRYGMSSQPSNMRQVTTVYWPDTIPPARVTDLRVIDSSDARLTLAWTATGDDSLTGLAYSYELRWSYAPLSDSNWSAANLLIFSDDPSMPGETDTVRTDRLSHQMEYFFGVRLCDEGGLCSGISNVLQHRVMWDDATPPAPVTDLRVIDSSDARLTLAWTATGDDSLTGQASSYEVRWSYAPLSDSNWSAANLLIFSDDPSMPGETDTVRTDRLSHQTEYFFGVRLCDEGDLCSGISNVLQHRVMWDDTIPPAVIDDLRASQAGRGEIEVRWTAPADLPDGGAVVAYDLRYSTEPIDESNFASCTRIETGTPGIPGTEEGLVVTVVDAYCNYYFAIRSVDEYDFLSAVSAPAYVSYEPEGLTLDWPELPDSLGVDRVLSFAMTHDGGTLVLFRPTWLESHDADIALLKVDADGGLVWQRTYGGAGYDDGVGILRLSTGYVLVANTESYGAGDKDVWLVWIDESGNVTQTKTIGDELTQYATQCDVSPTGGFAVGGVSSTIPGAFVTGLDNSGAIKWTKEHTLGQECLGQRGSESIYGIDFNPLGDLVYSIQSDYYQGHPSPGTGEWVCESYSAAHLMLVPPGGIPASIFSGSGYLDAPVFIKSVSYSGGSTWLFHYYDRYFYIYNPYGELFCWDESGSLVWKEPAPQGYAGAVALGSSQVIAVVADAHTSVLQLISYPTNGGGYDLAINVGSSVQAGGIAINEANDIVVAGSALKDGVRQIFIFRVER